jgi:peptidoglycan-associated lipoprotein
MKLPVRFLLTTVVATAALAACSSNKPKTTPPPVTDTTAVTSTTTGGKYTVESLDTDACLRQRVIYFDLDKTDIHSEFQAAIACHAAYLRQFPGARVTLEGNCDERGTREYNLGLGERRGNSVQGALGGAGASTSQLNVVSYGEERPVCREHGESCWQKNRRVEIVYTSKQ